MLHPLRLAKWLLPYGIARDILKRRQNAEWSARQRVLYRSFVPRDSLVFDIGANVGNRIGALLACGARVVAVEPQPRCIALIRREFRAQPVTVVQAAVGARPGTMPLHFGPDHDAVASLSPDFIAQAQKTGRFGSHQWAQSIDVPITTLDALVSEYGVPAFIKIDIEGYEAEALSGLSRPVPAVSFEWTPDMPHAAIQCLDRLADLGAAYFHFSFGESMTFSHSQPLGIDRAKALVEMLAEESSLFGDIYAFQHPVPRST